MVPITGRASSFIEFLKLQSQSKLNSNPFFALLSSCLQGQSELCGSYHLLQSCFSFFVRLHGNLSHLVAYQSCFSFLVHLHGQTEPFCSCIILGQPEVFASDHLLQSKFSLQLIFITSLQSFESGQALFLVVFSF